MSANPILDGVTTDDRLELVAAGSWTADHARELEPVVDAVAQTRGNIRQVALDLGKVERLDTVGAWLIERLRRAFGERGCELNLVGLRQDYRALIDDLAQVNRA